MATFLYVGDHERTFPGHPLQAGRGPFQPGEHVESDDNPDPRWFDEVTAGVPSADVPAQVTNDLPAEEAHGDTEE